jgi:hypothetical protein
MDDFRARDVWFDIPEGSVPDMACGGARNGVPNHVGTEYFRPEYFTVEFNAGRMTELRLWGRKGQEGWFARRAPPRLFVAVGVNL